MGDAVHWFGLSGTHNVSGELNIFPANPMGFSSGPPSVTLDYFFTFTVPGYYEYTCTEAGHFQIGTIIVLGTQGVEEQNAFSGLKLFPQPAGNELTIELKSTGLMHAELLSMDGRSLRSSSFNNLQRALIDVSGLSLGQYVLRLVDAKGNQIVRPFIKGS